MMPVTAPSPGRLARAARSAARSACFGALAGACLSGCVGTPPGADFERTASAAFAHPEETRLGRLWVAAARSHGDESGFRLINVGADGFRARMQMINAAQRTLDLQYYIFRGDETGRLLTDQLRQAADRGVRIRILIDDGDTVAGDEQILRLLALPSVEVRIFNPFRYRGRLRLVRDLEFLVNKPRLDYRMHNKLLVVDGAAALVGGRNIGNQYFQIDPESQFADYDVFAAGPIVSRLCGAFDEFWNSRLSTPAGALGHPRGRSAVMARTDKELDARPRRMQAPQIDYASLVATDDPLAGMVSGRLPLVWAHAEIAFDSPDKRQVVNGGSAGLLIATALADSMGDVKSEIIMVTPYFVPAADQLQLLRDLRRREIRVRILTNSLESTNQGAAQAGYDHYRAPLLEEGAELYEVRSLLGNAHGSGETTKLARFGNYALHGKMYVFDRRKLFIGSMNFDQRSKRINTEIALIIDSPEIAQQAVLRFEAMTRPENCYRLALAPGSAAGEKPRLVWRTEERGRAVEYTREPARSAWQRTKVMLMSLLPLRAEL